MVAIRRPWLALALLAAALLGGAALALARRGEIVWGASEPEGRRLAAAANKPLLLGFTASWSSASQELVRKTLSDGRVVGEAARFVAIQIDASDDGPQVDEILRRYRVAGLPTVILLDAAGAERHRFVGLVGADRLLEALREVR